MPKDMIAGRTVGWREWGTPGDRPALMIHCALAHSGAWGPVAEMLTDRLWMRGFDLPGHGGTDPWDGTGTYQEAARDIAIPMAEEMGQGAPIDLIGHSFGATTALRLAVDRPDHVRSLVLAEPVFFTPAFADDPALKTRHDREQTPYAEAIASGDDEAAAKAFMSVWGGGVSWELLPEEMRKQFVAQIPMVEAFRATNYGDPAGMVSRNTLADVTVPVLLIDGGDSPIYMNAINRALARRLPDARVMTVPGARHMVPITHPTPVAQAIREFL